MNTYSVDISSVDGITDSSFIILDVGVAVSVLVVSVPLSIIVEVFVQVGIVGSHWKLPTIGVLQRRVIASFEK